MIKIPLYLSNTGMDDMPSLEVSEISVSEDGNLVENGNYTYVRPYESFTGDVSDNKAYIIRKVKTLTQEEVDALAVKP